MILWLGLTTLIELYSSKAGANGLCAHCLLEIDLRISLTQQRWYGFSDSAMDYPLIELSIMRGFMGIDMISERISDAIKTLVSPFCSGGRISASRMLRLYWLIGGPDNPDLSRAIVEDSCVRRDEDIPPGRYSDLPYLKMRGMAMKQAILVGTTLSSYPSLREEQEE